MRSAKVDNDAWEGAWKIKLDILTLFYIYFSLKIGLASNLLDIVHKNFAERSTEEQVLERQRVSVDFCKTLYIFFQETSDEALDRAITSRTKLQESD